MKGIKVQGGTPNHHDSGDLCRTCRRATIVEGSSMGESLKYCAQTEERVTFDVKKCSGYRDSRLPTLYDMEDMAWVLKTDGVKKRIGFVPAKDLKDFERHEYVRTDRLDD